MTGIIEFLLFCGIVYYLLNNRVNDMVDIISNRLHQAYSKWESRMDKHNETNENSTARPTLDVLRLAGKHGQRMRINERENARKNREKLLLKLKETELIIPGALKSNKSFNQCCQNCTPTSRGFFNIDATNENNDMLLGRNILLVEPGSTLFSKIFTHISFIYNLKKYDYPRVTNIVLNDERLKEAVKSSAIERNKSESVPMEKAISQAESRAKSILSSMESTINNTLLKITEWILFKLLPIFVKSIIIDNEQMQMLENANNRGLPLIFLPLHKSHLDYILISFVLLCNNVKNCLVAAGNNLRIPIFGKLLSGLGAFYIKRRIDPTQGRKDILYRATLHTYVMECLRAGHNIEFFIEGGRSRTGKPCMPKGGMLSIIINAYMDGTIEDALLLPISINYERLVDGNFIKEQLGQPKKMETFGSAVRAIWSTLRGDYGIIKINICEAFSLREMLKSIENHQIPMLKYNNTINKNNDSNKQGLKNITSTSSLYGTDIIDDDHKLTVDYLSKHIIHDCAMATPVMSTNLVAFLLLNKYRDGCTLDKLIESFDIIYNELKLLNINVAFCGDTIDIVNHALKILGPGLVKQQRQEIIHKNNNGQAIKTEIVIAIKPISILPNVIELSYYSNTMVNYYVMESVVVSALYAELTTQRNSQQQLTDDNITIYKNKLIERSCELCDILKYEFIFCKPCEDLRDKVIETIDNLSNRGLLELCETGYLTEELWGKRFAKTLDDSSDEEKYNERSLNEIKYKLNLELDDWGRMKFIHTILRPIIDTYTYSAFTLMKLVNRSLEERDLIQEIFKEIQSNLERGIIYYGESLSIETIKNSLKLFEKWGILECHPEENVKIYYLYEEYDDTDSINELYESFNNFKWQKNTNQ